MLQVAPCGRLSSRGAEQPDLALALRLADAADTISPPRFRSGLAIETKSALTPVTEADRVVEADSGGFLAVERPGDAVLGEEQRRRQAAGSRAGSSTRSTGPGTSRGFRSGRPCRARGGRRRVGSASSPRPRSAAAGGPSGEAAHIVNGEPLQSRSQSGRRGRSPLASRWRTSVAGDRPARLARPRTRRLLGAHARRRGRCRRRGRRARHQRVGSRRGAGHRRGGRGSLLGLRRRARARLRKRRDLERAAPRGAARRRYARSAARSTAPARLVRCALVTKPPKDVVDVGDLLLEVPLALFQRLQELLAVRSPPTPPGCGVFRTWSPPSCVRSRNAPSPSRSPPSREPGGEQLSGPGRSACTSASSAPAGRRSTRR